MSRNFSLRLMVALLFLAAVHLAALPSFSSPVLEQSVAPALSARSNITAVCLMPLSPVIADSKPQDSSSPVQFSDPLTGLANSIELSGLRYRKQDCERNRTAGQIQQIPYWLLYRSLLI